LQQENCKDITMDIRYDKQKIISHCPIETSFSIFTTNDIRKLSVKKIITGMTFDKFGHPLKGGLYDPALGKTFYSIILLLILLL